MSKTTHISEETARIIDQEVNKIVTRNYQRARQILEENMDILHAMKDVLMKYETIDAHQVDDLMEKREVRPPADWKDDQPSNPTRVMTIVVQQNRKANLMFHVIKQIHLSITQRTRLQNNKSLAFTFMMCFTLWV